MSETSSFAIGPDDLPMSRVFSDLAGLVYAGDDFSVIHEVLCQAAPQLVPGCDHASLMIFRNNRFETAAASDDIGREVDLLERELGEGPCVDAILEEAAQLFPDLATESPWPRLAARVLSDTPVRGVAAFRLVIDQRKVGALNIFSRVPGALDKSSADAAIVLAAFASVTLIALDRKQEATNLRAGFASNREIAKAVGLMMAFHRISDDEALALLRKTSQDLNMKLSEVARQVLDHHHQR